MKQSCRVGTAHHSNRGSQKTWAVPTLPGYDIQHVVRRLQPSTELCLVAEPTNPHDEFAVEVFYGECKLGYVPRSDNRHLSRLLQQGVKLSCEVLEARPEATVWDMIRARVSLIV